LGFVHRKQKLSVGYLASPKGVCLKHLAFDLVHVRLFGPAAAAYELIVLHVRGLEFGPGLADLDQLGRVRGNDLVFGIRGDNFDSYVL
jgi:hypothetical protein